MKIPKEGKEYLAKKSFRAELVDEPVDVPVPQGASIEIGFPFSEGEEDIKGFFATLLDPPNEGVLIFLSPSQFEMVN